MRGQGAAAQPALLRIDGAGKIDAGRSRAREVHERRAAESAGREHVRTRRTRSQSITDMAYVNGRIYVAGLSNEEFASKLWSVAYPFAATDRGTSVEIFHGNHGRLETQRAGHVVRRRTRSPTSHTSSPATPARRS